MCGKAEPFRSGVKEGSRVVPLGKGTLRLLQQGVRKIEPPLYLLLARFGRGRDGEKFPRSRRTPVSLELRSNDAWNPKSSTYLMTKAAFPIATFPVAS